MRSVVFTRTAQKQLRRIDRQIRQTILQKIEVYATDPPALAGQVKKLRGSSYIRLRVGDYRVFFEEDHVVVQVIRVAHRREADR